MRHTILKISLIALICSLFAACDKVDEPLKSEYGFVDSVGGNKVVLLEEFTGVKCTYCPSAARQAKAIQSNYPDRVIILSIHAGFYSSTSPSHPVDLRTPAGNELLDILAPNQQSFPVGIFNRYGYPDNHRYTSFTIDWPAQVVNRLQDSVKANISAELTDLEETFEINIDVQLTEDINNANLFVSALLVEDSIIAPQTDNGKVIEDYVQDHVLRAAFNGTMGTELATGNLKFADRFRETFKLPKEEKWVTKNCHAIAFVYNGDTYEILQATKAELKE